MFVLTRLYCIRSPGVLLTRLYCIRSPGVLLTRLYCIRPPGVLLTRLYCIRSPSVLLTRLYCIRSPSVLLTRLYCIRSPGVLLTRLYCIRSPGVPCYVDCAPGDGLRFLEALRNDTGLGGLTEYKHDRFDRELETHTPQSLQSPLLSNRIVAKNVVKSR